MRPIPTDEATEAADTEPATAPAADARYVAMADLRDPKDSHSVLQMLQISYVAAHHLFEPVVCHSKVASHRKAPQLRKAASLHNLNANQTLSKLVLWQIG